jgi:hypothetical protein
VTDPTTEDRLRAALRPFTWGPGDEDEMLAALAPVVDELRREAAADALLAARDYARTATRTGFTENRGQEFTRHWSATAGWLKHRAEQTRAGREPDWPDAAYSDQQTAETQVKVAE